MKKKEIVMDLKKATKLSNYFMWPLRIFFILFLAQDSGHLLDFLISAICLAVVAACAFLIYYYADIYEQKNIKIYLEKQDEQKLIKICLENREKEKQLHQEVQEQSKSVNQIESSLST